MSPRAAGKEEASGRARLIETARRLFSTRGTAHVGINEVTAEAGVARMTLYNNFPSKEALTLAVYQEMAEERLKRLDAVLAGETNDVKRIASLFAHFGRNIDKPNYRGCSFILASLQEADPESAIHGLVRSYKKALRQRIHDALDDRRKNRSLLADQIVLLLDGAVTEAYIKGVADAMSAAKAAALILLAHKA
jgi:AcrR family transcriptional regulator